LQEVQVGLQALSLEKGNWNENLFYKNDMSRQLPRISEFPMSDISNRTPALPSPHRPALVKAEKDVPSFYKEFEECTSQYVVPHKEDSEEISDNGEFDDARHMRTYN
jgi:hypothetical protein